MTGTETAGPPTASAAASALDLADELLRLRADAGGAGLASVALPPALLGGAARWKIGRAHV